MRKNTSVNLDITTPATGYTIKGGTTTPLALTLAGTGDLTMQSSFKRSSTLSF